MKNDIRFWPLVALILLSTGCERRVPPQSQCEPRHKTFQVQGDSMSPHFRNGESLLVDLNAYQCPETAKPKPLRGEIVLTQLPGRPHPMVKRIVGVPGDRIELRAQSDVKYRILINDQEMKTLQGTPYEFDGSRIEKLRNLRVLKDGFYFLLGEIPEGTFDSSLFGPLQESTVIGKVVDHSNHVTPTPPRP